MNRNSKTNELSGRAGTEGLSRLCECEPTWCLTPDCAYSDGQFGVSRRIVACERSVAFFRKKELFNQLTLLKGTETETVMG